MICGIHFLEELWLQNIFGSFYLIGVLYQFSQRHQPSKLEGPWWSAKVHRSHTLGSFHLS